MHPTPSWHQASGPYDAWIEWDVTTIVRDWLGGTSLNHGFIVRQADITNSKEDQSITFSSRETARSPSTAPQLIVTCTP
jgi:hypothetical protein